MGVSGPVGLGQLYSDRIEQLWKNKKLGMTVSLPDVMRLIHQAILQDAQHAVAGANACVPLLGNNNASGLALTASIIALPVGGVTGRAELIQCNHLGMAEAATSDLPYVCVGSGQPLADPFLAFLRSVFWPNAMPTLADGIFATVWTLLHAIRVNPGGVSEPIQVATIGYKGKELFANELTPDQLQEHRENVGAAEKHLADFKNLAKDAPDSASNPPEPPAS